MDTGISLKKSVMFGVTLNIGAFFFKVYDGVTWCFLYFLQTAKKTESVWSNPILTLSIPEDFFTQKSVHDEKYHLKKSQMLNFQRG